MICHACGLRPGVTVIKCVVDCDGVEQNFCQDCSRVYRGWFIREARPSNSQSKAFLAISLFAILVSFAALFRSGVSEREASLAMKRELSGEQFARTATDQNHAKWIQYFQSICGR